MGRSGRWKVLRSIPHRGKYGAFSPNSGIKVQVAYACFVGI